MLDYVRREPIEKGWSCDRKYCVTTADGPKYLLRITPPEKSANRRDMFDMMRRVAALGVPMCRPVEFGRCEEGVYSLQSWIDGEDAEEALSAFSSARQYAYGEQAGRILQTIHSIPAPPSQEDWETRFNRKLDRKIALYRACPLQYENGEAFIECIEANRYLLKNRPQSFQHGDYHIGNMMLDRAGCLRIIDFDRFDFGDPWEEFNRIVWCASKMPPFASGMVNGYFDGAVPEKFWRLLTVYIAGNTLSSLPWAIPFGQNEVVTMRRQAQEVLGWHNGMKMPCPRWYAPKPPAPSAEGNL